MRTIRASGSSLLGKLSTWNFDEIENSLNLRATSDRPRGKIPLATHKPPTVANPTRRGKGTAREIAAEKSSISIRERRVHVPERRWRATSLRNAHIFYGHFQCKELPRTALRLNRIGIIIPACTGSNGSTTGGPEARNRANFVPSG
jgi:hypothetical protein